MFGVIGAISENGLVGLLLAALLVQSFLFYRASASRDKLISDLISRQRDEAQQAAQLQQTIAVALSRINSDVTK